MAAYIKRAISGFRKKRGTVEQYATKEQLAVITDLEAKVSTLQRELEIAKSEVTAYQQKDEKNIATLKSARDFAYAVGQKLDAALNVAKTLGNVGQEQSKFITEQGNAYGKHLTTEEPIIDEIAQYLKKKLDC
jgi:hypothetical protein